jgi:hypothetical protein
LDANVCIMVCLKCFGVEYLIFIYTHCPELMKSMGESWQFMITIHDEGDFPALCVWHASSCDYNIHSCVFYFQSVVEFPLQSHAYSCKCVLMFSWHWCEFRHCFVSITKTRFTFEVMNIVRKRLAWGKMKASMILIMLITINIIEIRTHMKQSWGGRNFGNAHK